MTDEKLNMERGGNSMFECECGAFLEVLFDRDGQRGWHECPECDYSELPSDIEPSQEYIEMYL